MPEKTKPKADNREPKKNSDEISAEKNENAKRKNQSEDQQKISYYYDDAYGYEIYNPEDEEDAN